MQPSDSKKEHRKDISPSEGKSDRDLTTPSSNSLVYAQAHSEILSDNVYVSEENHRIDIRTPFEDENYQRESSERKNKNRTQRWLESCGTAQRSIKNSKSYYVCPMKLCQEKDCCLPDKRSRVIPSTDNIINRPDVKFQQQLSPTPSKQSAKIREAASENFKPNNQNKVIVIKDSIPGTSTGAEMNNNINNPDLRQCPYCSMMVSGKYCCGRSLRPKKSKCGRELECRKSLSKCKICLRKILSNNTCNRSPCCSTLSQFKCKICHSNCTKNVCSTCSLKLGNICRSNCIKNVCSTCSLKLSNICRSNCIKNICSSCSLKLGNICRSKCIKNICSGCNLKLGNICSACSLKKSLKSICLSNKTRSCKSTICCPETFLKGCCKSLCAMKRCRTSKCTKCKLCQKCLPNVFGSCAFKKICSSKSHCVTCSKKSRTCVKNLFTSCSKSLKLCHSEPMTCSKRSRICIKKLFGSSRKKHKRITMYGGYYSASPSVVPSPMSCACSQRSQGCLDELCKGYRSNDMNDKPFEIPNELKASKSEPIDCSKKSRICIKKLFEDLCSKHTQCRSACPKLNQNPKKLFQGCCKSAIKKPCSKPCKAQSKLNTCLRKSQTCIKKICDGSCLAARNSCLNSDTCSVRSRPSKIRSIKSLFKSCCGTTWKKLSAFKIENKKPESDTQNARLSCRDMFKWLTSPLNLDSDININESCCNIKLSSPCCSDRACINRKRNLNKKVNMKDKRHINITFSSSNQSKDSSSSNINKPNLNYNSASPKNPSPRRNQPSTSTYNSNNTIPRKEPRNTTFKPINKPNIMAVFVEPTILACKSEPSSRLTRKVLRDEISFRNHLKYLWCANSEGILSITSNHSTTLILTESEILTNEFSEIFLKRVTLSQPSFPRHHQNYLNIKRSTSTKSSEIFTTISESFSLGLSVSSSNENYASRKPFKSENLGQNYNFQFSSANNAEPIMESYNLWSLSEPLLIGATNEISSFSSIYVDSAPFILQNYCEPPNFDENVTQSRISLSNQSDDLTDLVESIKLFFEKFQIANTLPQFSPDQSTTSEDFSHLEDNAHALIESKKKSNKIYIPWSIESYAASFSRRDLTLESKLTGRRKFVAKIPQSNLKPLFTLIPSQTCSNSKTIQIYGSKEPASSARKNSYIIRHILSNHELYIPDIRRHQGRNTLILETYLASLPIAITEQPRPRSNQPSGELVKNLDNTTASISTTKSPPSSPSNEPSAPESLLNAPPSYSSVMRQISARQRPRYMGTFVASPSYVQRAPPPTYATSFDLYVEPQVAPVPPVHPTNFGLNPILLVCPECGNLVLTVVRSEVTLCTHLCAACLCVCFCWLCAPIPYLLRSCKNIYHSCPICRSHLGMYSPTSTTF